jgi:hypothetical protein
MGVAARAELVERERDELLATRDSGQPGRLLRLVSAQQQGLCAQQQRGHQRLRHEAPAALLQHHGQVEEAEPEPVVRLGQLQTQPAEAGHLAPQVVAEAALVPRVAQRAQAPHGGVLVHELTRRAAQHLLLFVEDEAQRLLTVAHDDAHLPSGRPSTCLAMMLSWISLDPPSMVLARERSHSRV